ncbi:RDD family protein [Streptomyces sp. NPDC048514]|uniref:RDD family protein n=1 Tax=Streptomyces sp. NPDC048514 TaxID=3365564 RepID=UPI0037198516
MSAPTPAPGDDRPREGYYPDPSIPGYVRYWNGASWVPGTSRPAPKDGEPLSPPPGVRPAAPAVEETGPHFFDEDPRPHSASPHSATPGHAAAGHAAPGHAGPGHAAPGNAGSDEAGWPADPRIPADRPADPAGHAGHAARAGGTASVPQSREETPDPGGTFIFRRPVPGPAAVQDDGTMTFRPVPGQGRPSGQEDPRAQGGAAGGFGPAGHGEGGFGPAGHGAAAAGPGAAAGTGPAGGPGFGTQGPVGAPPSAAAPSSAGSPPGTSSAAGPGFGAGKAAVARAAQTPQPAPPGQAPQAAAPGQAAQPAQPGPAAQPGQASHTAPPGQASPVPRQGQPSPGFPASAARQAPAAPAAAAPSVPQQGGAGTPLTPGPGGGQASWAQQVHQLAGGADEQPVAPWKPPVEDLFQAAARRQAAARPAGLGRRLAARLIDTLVIGAATAAAAVPLGLRAADHIQQKIDEARLSGRTVTVWLLDGTTGTSLGVVLGVLLLFGVAYEVLPTTKWGRTLGKKLCRIEVRDIEAHEPPSFGAALRRWLVYSVPGLLGIGILGVLWCLFDRPWRQCWHDKAAHTFVAG